MAVVVWEEDGVGVTFCSWCGDKLKTDPVPEGKPTCFGRRICDSCEDSLGKRNNIRPVKDDLAKQHDRAYREFLPRFRARERIT